jgi:hypothetical protein
MMRLKGYIASLEVFNRGERSVLNSQSEHQIEVAVTLTIASPFR